MKAVILAGGYGTRISEESGVRPKPLVEIGGQPILWHIMKIYSLHGINDFIICCGYKGHMIKEYFASYFLRRSDVTFDLRTNEMEVHHTNVEPWKVTLVHTGYRTMTGGRIRRVAEYLGDEPFCLTYGDGVSDVDLTELIKFHRAQGSLSTVTGVQPPGRFGVFTIDSKDNRIDHFKEKPNDDGAWVNGGFFVLEPGALEYIADDNSVWEQEPMERLAHDGMLSVFRHRGFWQPMDTLRDKQMLEDLWQSKAAPWRKWN
ncbi:MAG: glucose-1-phosphate cytidylyltransferase [Blastocatellia bacterium]|nr:glucose-1-phosphate cytidylyltransferase [Blastocatellia bacterium]